MEPHLFVNSVHAFILSFKKYTLILSSQLHYVS